jgi:predicted neuraminidase
MSWSICTPTKLPNPNSALDLLRLPSGEVLLVYNPSAVNRNYLTVALSKDNTQSWFARRDIVHGDGEYSYPSAILDDQGWIHVSYTENRYIIKHAVFNKEWLLEKQLSEPISTE